MRDNTQTSVAGITIDCNKKSRKDGTVITARRDGKILKCEKVDLFDVAARTRFATDVAEIAKIEVEAVNDALMKLVAGLTADAAEEGSEEQGEVTASDPLDSMSEEDREAGRALLNSPDLLDVIGRDCSAMGVAGESDLVTVLYLVGTSRLLEKPLAACVQGSSSSGKSHVIETVAKLFPSEAKLEATQMTPKALLYLPPESLKHRWIVAGERSRRQDKLTAEATRLLREMLSGGKLKVPVTKKGDERPVTEVIEQDGPIAYTESTTLPQIFAEDANRMLALRTDEGVQQTRCVIDHLGRVNSNGDATAEKAPIIAKHHAAQRMLKQHDVVVPFAERLAVRFPANRVEARRGFPQLLSLIRAVCLLYQFQRETDEQGRLIATEDDYRVARRLFLEPMDRLLRGRVSDPAARFLEGLNQRFSVADVFTSKEAARGEGKSQRTVDSWLKELHEVGLIQQVTAHRGPVPTTWRLSAQSDASEQAVLPAVEDIFGPEEPVELREAG